MNIKPFSDTVIIEPGPKKTDSKIAIPDSAKESIQALSNEGTVVAVGPGKKSDTGCLIPMKVKVGDRVIYGIATLFLMYKGKKYFYMAERALVGTIEPEIIGANS